MKRGFAVLVFLAATPLAAVAHDVQAQFTVSAVVMPRASIETVSQPPQFPVSEQDIARGYVDVAAVYRVRNNDPLGYLVRLVPRTGLTRSVEVSGLASPVVMHDEIVEVSQPAALRSQELILRFRLVLDAAATPGTYAMPVQVVVATL
jgi:hypothetical protein